MKKQILPALLIALTACSASESTTEHSNSQKDQIIISYQATTDESGSCRPTYLAQTPNDAEGMPLNKIYMVNGETGYYNADGRKIGNIPLQLKMDDEVISVINEALPCEELTIKLEVEQCRYMWGTERTDCPEFVITGQEAFGAIELKMNLKSQK